MSAITVNRRPLSLDGHLSAFLKRLFTAKVTQGRLYRELKDLPDHLLLDIGIDPRNAPISLDEAIARPDLARGGLVAPHQRTVAMS